MSEDVVGNIVKKLFEREPCLSGVRHAAVAMIIADENDPKILLIRRAERAGDPWSGQVALPGGKSQPGDASLKGTAVRETSEEVGINLQESAEFIGYGEPVTTHTGTVEVVPCVFLMRSESGVRSNEEVASHVWVSVRGLSSPEARIVSKIGAEKGDFETPAILISDYVVWGLTYRILTSLL